ncbi:MAG TPA: NAD(P)H-hydrate dehydratase [Ramlibacter sp.]|nr:NAD(P)H-hydrate dehydratase [Ramlibacter sp.]
MQRIKPNRAWPLYDIAATRRIEQAAAVLRPSHALMQAAGLAVARLALALAPHARRVWVACGPGNNGGDGLEAAMHLQQWGKQAVVTWAGDPSRLPADAAASLGRARGAGVLFAEQPPEQADLCIDALLGIGSRRPLEGRLAEWARAMNANACARLAVDLPSGLDADCGAGGEVAVRATHTLSLLTLKPGLFTAQGRDACGQVWLDPLGVGEAPGDPTAWLAGPPPTAQRPHGSHKGTYGDVAVIGGAAGMAGAALLAASAALHGGAGRVFVGLLDAQWGVDLGQPELMLRPWESLDLRAMHLACGCGGGDAVRAALPRAISQARSLVLDADALNAVAADSALQSLLQSRGRSGRPTVLTPHPLEAARLLGRGTQDVQAARLGAAAELARRFACTVLLKGSGSVIADPGRPPAINSTGNARLATAGTGDVLAGLLAARLAAGETAFDAAVASAWLHGRAADLWCESQPLTASGLARRLLA